MGLVLYLGRATARGGLADLWVQNVVRDHVELIQATVERYAPGVPGAARFSVTIDAQGEVVRARVQSSFGVADLDAALANVLAELRFPAAEPGAGETLAEWDVTLAPPPVMAIPSGTR